MRRKTDQRGFSFMEILIVIVIICLLAMLIIPIYSSMRKRGRRTACMSNLRQVGMALQLYGQDYDEFMPIFLNRRHDKDGKSTPWDSPEGISYAVTRKSKDPRILFCPADVYAGRDIDVFGVNHKYSSYFFNTIPPESPKGRLTISGLELGGTIMVQPADYPLVRDSNLGSSETVDGTQAYGCEHMGTVNIVYLDFHTETKNAKDVKDVP